MQILFAFLAGTVVMGCLGMGLWAILYVRSRSKYNITTHSKQSPPVALPEVQRPQEMVVQGAVPALVPQTAEPDDLILSAPAPVPVSLPESEFVPRPERVTNPTTIAHINEWPCAVGMADIGPVVLLVEPLWGDMISGKAAIDIVFVPDYGGLPVLHILPRLEPEGQLPQRYFYSLLPRQGDLLMLREMAKSSHINLQLLFWDPALGWMEAFTKQISFPRMVAKSAIEYFEAWLDDNDPVSDELAIRHRMGGSPFFDTLVERLSPCLQKRTERSDAVALLCNNYVPATILPALRTIKELTWEESIHVEPLIHQVAHWYVPEIIQEIANCHRKGPRAVMKSALAFTRDPRVLDIALNDEVLLAELGFDVIPICSWPGHLPGLMALSHHPQLFYRSLAARSLAAVVLLTGVEPEQRAAAIARLTEMASKDRSKAVQEACLELLKTDEDTFWEKHRPRFIQPIGLSDE